MNIKLGLALIIVAMLYGCSYNVSPYGASAKDVEAIKGMALKPVSVARFDAAKPGLNSISCRAAGAVKVSPSFEDYIEKALIDELKLAGAYDPNSKLVLKGRLDEIDFSSGMSDGNWSFTVTVTNAGGDSFVTQSKSEFSGGFIAEHACQQTAQAFTPAVQKLVEDIVRNPKFKQVANP